MRVVLPFKLVGQKLVKGRDFPKSVADGSKNSVVIKVDGIPDGCVATGYFKLSWESNTTYDLTFDGNELVVDEHIVNLPAYANNKYVDYKFSFSVAILEGGVERLTTTPVEIVVEKSNYVRETTNTPDIPESQYNALANRVAEVADLAGGFDADIAALYNEVGLLKENAVVVDDALSSTSENPVQNKVVHTSINGVHSVAIGARSVAAEAKQTAEEAKQIASEAVYTADSVRNQLTLGVIPRLDALEQGGTGGGKLDVHEVEGYAFAVGDEDGNVSFGVRDNGKVVFDKGDYETYETDEYAYAVCDEYGHVVFAITKNGEVKYQGAGEGDTPTIVTGATIDLYKCGLPVLALTGDTSAMTKDAAVDLSYTIKSPKGTAIASGTCSCKWQGSSSVRKGYPKRNYTIKLDAAVEATRAISRKDGVDAPTQWGEQKKYCLKANWIDPSNARNVVNAKLWASVVASRESVPNQLAAAPNKGAIDGFPCIIVINGEFEGLYTFNIPKDGWMFNMGEGLTEYVVCGEENGKAACGFYASATFTEDADGKVDYSVEYKPDGVEDAAVVASFNNAIQAVMNAPNSADWEEAVAPYFDIASAIDYYIFVCCISGHDNLRRNTLYGTYDGVKWFISAYDLDTTLGFNPYGTCVFPVKTERTQFYEAANGSTRHRLFELIYKYSRDKLKARYAELRSTVLSDENVWYVFTNFVNGIPRAVYNLDAEKWADKKDGQGWAMPATTTANVENYMQYYRMHCALLDKEMEE